MQMVKCINKIRDGKGKIIGYTLQSSTGETKKVEKNSLKEAVRNGKIGILNMTLTSDNRLVDKAVDNKSQKPIQKEKLDINSILNKARMSGRRIIGIPTGCGKPCYLISNKKYNHHVVVIPDNVTSLNGDRCGQVVNLIFANCIKKLHGVLEVIGGSNLKSTYAMFNWCEAQAINLSSFDTGKVTDMGQMFYCCKAQSIDLSGLDTSKVTDMRDMFLKCEAQSLDLSSFDTSNVTNMICMFEGCGAQVLDLSSFDTRRVADMSHMFYESFAQSIDLSSFVTSNVTDMSGMFTDCTAQVKTSDPKILKELRR